MPYSEKCSKGHFSKFLDNESKRTKDLDSIGRRRRRHRLVAVTNKSMGSGNRHLAVLYVWNGWPPPPSVSAWRWGVMSGNWKILLMKVGFCAVRKLDIPMAGVKVRLMILTSFFSIGKDVTLA